MNYIAILIISAAAGLGSPQLIEAPNEMTYKACLIEVGRVTPIKQKEGYTVLGGGCVTRDALGYLKKVMGQ